MAKSTETKTPHTQVSYKNKPYKSMAALALAFDLNPSNVRRKVRSGASLDDAMKAALDAKKEAAKKDAA